jgi:hypothetical protein
VIVDETLEDQALKDAISKVGPYKGKVVEKRSLK